jgi:hypothetical protein
VFLVAIGTLAWTSTILSSTIHYDGGKAPPTPIIQDLVYTGSPTASAIKGAISFYGNQYGFQTKILTAIASCETTFRGLCIIDTNGKLSCGIFQFQKATFHRYCPDLQWNYSVNDDILCAERMIGEGGMDIVKKNWVTCSAKIPQS